MPLIPPILAFGILSCAAFAAAVLSTTALFVVRRQYSREEQRAQHHWAEWERKSRGTLAELAQRVDSLATELHDFGQQAGGGSPGNSAMAGLNLTKRAQALRLHRRGDSPDQIAALLGVPLQEVDLLLKVQRIVLTNL